MQCFNGTFYHAKDHQAYFPKNRNVLFIIIAKFWGHMPLVMLALTSLEIIETNSIIQQYQLSVSSALNAWWDSTHLHYVIVWMFLWLEMTHSEEITHCYPCTPWLHQLQIVRTFFISSQECLFSYITWIQRSILLQKIFFSPTQIKEKSIVGGVTLNHLSWASLLGGQYKIAS